MSREEKIEKTQWFVDFANADLNSISGKEKRALCEEAKIRLWPAEVKRIIEEVKWGSSKEMAATMSWATSKLPRIDSKEFWEKIIHLQSVVREHLSYLIPRVLRRYGRLAPGRSMGIRAEEAVIFQIEWGGKYAFSLSYLVFTSNQGDYLCVHIWSLLAGLPGCAIRACEHCKKFFFNPTNREKTFCTAKCRDRFNSAKRRQADPQAYKKKQAEIMWRKYPKKVKRGKVTRRVQYDENGVKHPVKAVREKICHFSAIRTAKSG